MTGYKLESLRKLQLWGEKVSKDFINFEFPTEEMVRFWPKNIRLESIKFKRASNNGFVSSVRCTYSN